MAAKRSRLKAFAPGVRWKNGAWRWRVPMWVDDATLCRVLEGKREITLGKNQALAAARYIEILDLLGVERRATGKIGDLMDRYAREVVPTKKPASQRSNVGSLARLRPVFGHMPVEDFESRHAFQYRDTLKATPTTANRDIEVLSHLFSKAIEWGVIRNEQHPIRGLRVKNSRPPRDRYVTDEELTKALQVAPPFIVAYVRLKLALGLRKADMLRLRLSDAAADGIRAAHTKTGKRTVYAWTDERRAAWDACMAVRPRRVANIHLLFCTRHGQPYVTDDGRTAGFNSVWQRFMAKAVASGVQRFTEHDLRAKVASDSSNAEQARARLGHASAATTKRVYMRKDEVAE